ncbi:Urea-proton symporter DUR3 [Psilocybe cubensis]|uniref:Urea-proton symporter DUR3 n=1 Tax=Psilocybe cubensis TaxID=181762 RepID=A0ACB8GXY5_PSICU|nr:Urea-proton symporter DUR3 [Psilocybe cubensis]KAH9480101.1 Urea-proton symporter DUR3 [Psilocybe cubensis]
MSEPILPSGAGYGVGIGLLFSLLMICVTGIQARYTTYSPKDSEEFTSASRSVKPGLIATGIVSAWTWAATLVSISGPWWYGAGATVQILLFAMLAAKLKMNAPYAHTWLEIVAARWGKTAHIVFMFLGFSTNLIVSSMLILGGSATVNDLTGMNTIAACFLIPLGVALYVRIGGMRSTLLCDYTHTTILFAITLTFIFTVYAVSDKIGSPTQMHDLLAAVSLQDPVPGNAHGSYLTMRSKNGLIFGVINLVGNFSTVFQDQAYWQRAIASRPASTVKAYLLGGLAWFSIPFTFATTLGLAAVALKGSPGMRILTPSDVSAGLPASAAATALLGKAGAACLLLVLFLAVTSACSAELIAVSSLLTYDVYKTYINPKATDAQILKVGHAMVLIYALGCGVAGLVFFYIGVSMGWLYTFMGVILGSGVVPIAICITWRKANKWGCISGTVIGFVAGVIAWIVTTSRLNGGVINVTTTGGSLEMLAGNLASILTGGIISVTASIMWPENFDWVATRAINQPRPISVEMDSMRSATSDMAKMRPASSIETDVQSISGDSFNDQIEKMELDPVKLKKAFQFASWSSLSLFVILILVIPLPLFFSRVVFGKSGLTAWVIMGVAWTICSAVVVILYPFYESRDALEQISKQVLKDLFGKSNRHVTHLADNRVGVV